MTETRVAILPCEGQCNSATEHHYDKVLSSIPRRNGIGTFWNLIFRCTTCRQRRIWGNRV